MDQLGNIRGVLVDQLGLGPQPNEFDDENGNPTIDKFSGNQDSFSGQYQIVPADHSSILEYVDLWHSPKGGAKR